MSAIASFYLLPTDKLIGLREVWPDYYHYIQEHAEEYFEDYGWSGYCIGSLLDYLKDTKNIDLGASDYNLVLTGAYEEGFWIFDKPLKDKYLKLLEPKLYSDKELKSASSEYGYGELDAPAKPFRDGLVIFQKAMKLVSEKAIMLVHVG